EMALTGWLERNGGKLVDWRSDSGARPLERHLVASGLASSPVLTSSKNSSAIAQSATLPVGSALASDALATSKSQRYSGVGTDAPGARSITESMTTDSAAPRKRGASWVVPLAGGAVLALVVGVLAFVMSRGGRQAAASTAPSVVTVAATAAEPPATAATPNATQAASTEAPPAEVSTTAETATSAPEPTATARSGGGASHSKATTIPASRAKAPASTASTTAAASVSASPPPQNTANAESVGGRTIRTDL
ncbi:MAG TPA: hypothetical protein VM580_06930, partial [Labilithrix sp.]|nr:hypothetical protein [Labilithrix sp.]